VTSPPKDDFDVGRPRAASETPRLLRRSVRAGGSARGPAEARRVATAGLGDLAERQAAAIAALDHALEARLGELDRAFDTRRTHLEARLHVAERTVGEAGEHATAEIRRAASDERRLLAEESAAALSDLDDAVRRHLVQLEEITAAQLESLGQLIERVHDLEQAAVQRARDLGGDVDGSDDGPGERRREQH
jgi:hypothetical protein